MAVVLLRFFIPFPRRSAKSAQPIIRKSTFLSGVFPNEPVPLGIVARASTLEKPRMFTRGMIGHKIQNDLESSRMRLGNQFVKICEASEDFVHCAIIRYVVSKIRHRRRVNR